jgi:hypothetical protein
MRFVSHLLVVAAVLATFIALDAAVPSAVAAQRGGRQVRINRPHTGDRPLQLDLHAGFAWYGRGLATGVRFGIPIVENGFVPPINNAVYINFGLDLYFIRYRCGPCRGNEYRNGTGIGLPVTMHWEFYFTEHWSAFGEVGLNPFIHPRYFDEDDWYFDGRHWFIVAVGGRYAFNENIAITLRIGSPYAAFGVTFFF